MDACTLLRSMHTFKCSYVDPLFHTCAIKQHFTLFTLSTSQPISLILSGLQGWDKPCVSIWSTLAPSDILHRKFSSVNLYQAERISQSKFPNTATWQDNPHALISSLTLKPHMADGFQEEPHAAVICVIRILYRWFKRLLDWFIYGAKTSC